MTSTPSKHKRLPWLLAYGVLFFLSLPIPELHQAQTDRVIEAMRPVIQLEDGSLSPMMMPVHILFWRWLGQLSQVFPALLLVLIALSLWRDKFSQPAVLICVAIGQCGFATIYALYSAFLLGLEVLP